MKRKLFIIGIISIILVSCSPFGSANVPPTQKIADQMKESEKMIQEKGCQAGDFYYLQLAQSHRYSHNYSQALDTLKKMSECYRGVYLQKTEKNKLLLNNIGSIYEDWWRTLESAGDKQGAVLKFKKAIDAYTKILSLYSGTKILDEDEVREYKEKITTLNSESK